jgi:hypothetical protein
MIVKIYILICLVPGLILWLFFHFNYLIKSNFLRNLLKPLVLILSVGIGFVAMRTISSESSRYSLDSITHTMQETAWWLAYMSQLEGGSYYSLGDIEYTTTGLLKKMPAAVNVTLFRPYLWEAKNVVMILSAIESFTLLLLTLYILFWKPGIRKSFKIIANDPFVLFSVIFSISFAFAIGISTYNFGSLVRYKIPLLPFYILALAVIHSYAKKKRSGRQQSFPPPVTTPENNEHDIEDQWII